MRLYGTNPVKERLRANPRSIRRIYIQEGFADSSYICKKAGQNNIPVVFVPQSKMNKIARNLHTQGILIDIDEFAYSSFDDC